MIVANKYEGAVIEITGGESIVNVHNARAGECFPALHCSDGLLVGQTKAWELVSLAKIARLSFAAYLLSASERRFCHWCWIEPCRSTTSSRLERSNLSGLCQGAQESGSFQRALVGGGLELFAKWLQPSFGPLLESHSEGKDHEHYADSLEDFGCGVQ